MSHSDLLAFAKAQKLAVISTIAPGGVPHGAVVGVAVTDDFELVFDTLNTTRKWANLKANPSIAVTLGWDAETLQLEGAAEELSDAALAPYQELYFSIWPDGSDRLSWPGITYFKVTPRWMRYSDFRPTPPRIVELKLQ
jgi:pyridoxine/pyridoxamine 5'-phosphate oxidase